MALSKLSAMCNNCMFKDTCEHKRMEAVGILEPVAQSTIEDAAAPLMVKHSYRDVYIDKNITVTIDLEELKKELENAIYRDAGLMMYGG